MILVVGATGQLGSEICAALARSGRAVRGMVRADSRPETVERLRGAGVETVTGDLTDRASLERACAGATAVVSTANAVAMRREGDDFERVDRRGQLDLVAAAAAAGVEHFIFVSFPPFPGEVPLQDAKRAVEAALGAASMAHTILQAPHFREDWLAAPTGVNPETGAMKTFGGGEAPIAWIARADVCDAVCASLDAPQARNRTLRIGGAEAVSQAEVIARCERLAGRPIIREDTPLAQIDEMAASDHPLMRTYAGLMRVCAVGGCAVDNGEAAAVLGYRPRPLDDYLSELVSTLPAS